MEWGNIMGKKDAKGFTVDYFLSGYHGTPQARHRLMSKLTYKHGYPVQPVKISPSKKRIKN